MWKAGNHKRSYTVGLFRDFYLSTFSPAKSEKGEGGAQSLLAPDFEVVAVAEDDAIKVPPKNMGERGAEGWPVFDRRAEEPRAGKLVVTAVTYQ